MKSRCSKLLIFLSCLLPCLVFSFSSFQWMSESPGIPISQYPTGIIRNLDRWVVFSDGGKVNMVGSAWINGKTGTNATTTISGQIPFVLLGDNEIYNPRVDLYLGPRGDSANQILSIPGWYNNGSEHQKELFNIINTDTVARLNEAQVFLPPYSYTYPIPNPNLPYHPQELVTVDSSIVINSSGHYNKITLQGDRNITVQLSDDDIVLRINHLNVQQGNIVISRSAGATGRLFLFVDDEITFSGSSQIGSEAMKEETFLFYNGTIPLSWTGNTDFFGSIFLNSSNFSLGGSSKVSGSYLVARTSQSIDLSGGSATFGGVFAQQATITLGGSALVQGVMTGGSSVVVGGGVPEFPYIYAPSAKVELKASAKIQGTVIADELIMDGSSYVKGPPVLSFPPPEIPEPIYQNVVNPDEVPDPNYFVTLHLYGSPGDYVIHYGDDLEISGDSTIDGNVASMSGNPPSIGGNAKITGRIEQSDTPPVCCSDCSVPSDISSFAVGISFGSGVYSVDQNTIFNGSLRIKNNETLRFNTSVNTTLYLIIDGLEVDGNVEIIGSGKVIIIVNDSLEIKGDINKNGLPSQLFIVFNGNEFKQSGGGGITIRAMLCFTNTVSNVDIGGNMTLDGAISAPSAHFKLRGTINISRWFYGNTFDINGNVNIFDSVGGTNPDDFGTSYGVFHVPPEAPPYDTFDSIGQDLSTGFDIIFREDEDLALPAGQNNRLNLTLWGHSQWYWHPIVLWDDRDDNGFGGCFFGPLEGNPREVGSGIRAVYINLGTFIQPITIENDTGWKLEINTDQAEPFIIEPGDTATIP